MSFCLEAFFPRDPGKEDLVYPSCAPLPRHSFSMRHHIESEEIRRGRLSELLKHYSSEEAPRGEFVLVIDRNEIADSKTDEPRESISALVARFKEEGLDHRAALKKAARA